MGSLLGSAVSFSMSVITPYVLFWKMTKVKILKKNLSTPVIISHLAVELSIPISCLVSNIVLTPRLERLHSSSIFCKNLQTAISKSEIVDNLLWNEVEPGFMISPFWLPPFQMFCISPIRVATRKFSGKKAHYNWSLSPTWIQLSQH